MRNQLRLIVFITFVCHLSTQSQVLKVNKTAVSAVPSKVQDWLDAELATAKRKELIDLGSPAFFTRDTARVIGYIKGYNRGLGFSTGMVYAQNVLTNESFPQVVTIHEDGRFDVKIPMNHPIYTYAAIDRQAIPFYLEPGQTLSLVLNWDEFIAAKKVQNTRYMFKDIHFAGPLSRINSELMKLVPDDPDHRTLQERIKKETPAEFNQKQMAFWEESRARLEDLLKDQNFTDQSKTILRNGIITSNAAYLFDFVMNREYAARTDSTGSLALKAPVNPEYYAFLHQMPLNDPTLLISPNFSTFINRFEFSRPFMQAPRITAVRSQVPLYIFLFRDLGLKKTQADEEFLQFMNEKGKTFNTLLPAERETVVKEITEATKAFAERYKEYDAQYKEKYPFKSRDLAVEPLVGFWVDRDSVMRNYYKLSPNLVYEIAKIRTLKFNFSQQLKGRKDEARTFLTALEKTIQSPFLIEEAERFFNQSYPAVPATAYDLPAGLGTDIFKKIVDQYKGKMLFVDFWATTCGPCIASIKQKKSTRDKLKDDKDFDFVFITSDRESPQKRYDEFIKEQDLAKTYRLPDDDFKYLRQLFKFNGIPRYVLIGKDGKVLNDDFPMYRLESEIAGLVGK